jgi:chromosome segregation ATPase
MSTTPRTDAARADDNGDASWVFDEIEKLETELAAANKDNAAFRAYVFEMESALRGARASGTASGEALVRAHCAELHYSLTKAQEQQREDTAEMERLDAQLAQQERAIQERGLALADSNAEVARLKFIEEKFKQSPHWDTLAIVKTRNNWQERAEKAEAELKSLQEDWRSINERMTVNAEIYGGLLASNTALRKALNLLMVPFNESITRHNGGVPSGVYVKRARFEQARAALALDPLVAKAHTDLRASNEKEDE